MSRRLATPVEHGTSRAYTIGAHRQALARVARSVLDEAGRLGLLRNARTAAIFGSYASAKERPNDIDIAVLVTSVTEAQKAYSRRVGDGVHLMFVTKDRYNTLLTASQSDHGHSPVGIRLRKRRGR